VCVLTTAYPDRPGGTRGVFIHELCRRLVVRGHQVDVVTPRVLPASNATERIEGVRVWRFPFPTEGKVLAQYDTVPVRRMVPWMLSATRHTLGVVEAADCDVIHAHWVVPMGVVARIASAWTGRPYVVSSHGLDLMKWSRHRAIRPLARWSVQRAKAYSSCNDAMVDEFARLGADRRRLLLIRESGADTDLFRPGVSAERVRRNLRLTAAEQIVLFVGHLMPRKGPDVLLRAFSRVAQEFPGARLVIVGSGEDEGALRLLSRDLGVATRTDWLGLIPHDELPAYFVAADVFVLPSWSEGFPHVLMEAAACGVPAVASNIPGNSGLVVEGVTGLLFEPGDVGGLAEGLRKLLADPCLRGSMAASARNRAEELFRAEDQTRKVEELYRCALAGDSRLSPP